MPAYVYPDAILALVERGTLPQLLVINPASGPGAAADAEYRHAIAAAQAAGSRVLGYIATTWGARPAAEVSDEIDRYRDWYHVDGVFLDEAASDEAQLTHYHALIHHARAEGARFIVLNPGLVPARGYFDLADVVVTFEGPISALSRGPCGRCGGAGALGAPRLRGVARAGAARDPIRDLGPVRLHDVGHPPPPLGHRAGLPGPGARRARRLPMTDEQRPPLGPPPARPPRRALRRRIRKAARADGAYTRRSERLAGWIRAAAR